MLLHVHNVCIYIYILFIDYVIYIYSSIYEISDPFWYEWHHDVHHPPWGTAEGGGEASYDPIHGALTLLVVSLYIMLYNVIYIYIYVHVHRRCVYTQYIEYTYTVGIYVYTVGRYIYIIFIYRYIDTNTVGMYHTYPEVSCDSSRHDLGPGIPGETGSERFAHLVFDGGTLRGRHRKCCHRVTGYPLVI